MSCAEIENRIRGGMKYVFPTLLLLIVTMGIPYIIYISEGSDISYFMSVVIWNGFLAAFLGVLFCLFRFADWVLGDISICKDNRKYHRW